MWKGFLEAKRIVEIKKFITEHPEITHWVSVDDLDMSNSTKNRNLGLDNFVLTPRMNEGIKQSGIKDKILKLLI